MGGPTQFRAVEYGCAIDEITDSYGGQLYRPVTVVWSEPEVWEKGASAPVKESEKGAGYLCAIIRNHPASKQKDRFHYIGITTNIGRRFYNHEKAHDLAAKRGKTSLSIGRVDFGEYRKAKKDPRLFLEEIESILIWVLSPVENEKKIYNLPGLNERVAHAWHIFNEGYRFAGQMPYEIVYPWILTKPGRDRSWK